MGYFAETDPDGQVLRVVVADSAEWCVEHLGGQWVETADPADPTSEVAYCGPGWGVDESWPERFAPAWRQPLGADVDGSAPYAQGALVFHAGRIWRSTVEHNVWEPGVSGWHDSPDTGLPQWVQPTGAHDAYGLGAEVTHNGRNWRSLYAGNVWEPGVFGWKEI